MNNPDRRQRQNQSGSMLVIAACSAAVIAILITGVLSYIGNEYKLNIRSHKWTQALALAEAGVDIGFTEFNNYYAVGDNGFTSSRGWVNGGGGTYYRYISNFTNAFGENLGIVYSYVNGVGSANPYLFAYGGTQIATNGSWIYRAVECRLGNSSQFPAGMVAKGGIDMKGNGVTTDSYDSTDVSKSTNGRYDPAKKQPNGDIATNDAITNSTISVQNANIYGVALTGPSGSVSLGSQGSIGPTFSNPATDIPTAQANGWIRNDFAVDIPDVVLPAGATSWTSTSASSLGTGDYKMTNISGNMTITGNVRIYLTGSMSFNGNKGLTINSGASLIVYSAGSLDLGGNGIVNNSQNAMSCQFYGLPTCTSVDIHGNGNWCGIVYAPNADLNIGGGGSSGDVSGAVVVKNIGMNGHVTFHYDESLRKSGPSASYNIASWKSYRWNAVNGWIADN